MSCYSESISCLILRKKGIPPKACCKPKHKEGFAMHESLLKKLYEELQLRGRAKTTISTYTTEVKSFLKFYTGPLDELSVQEVKNYQLHLIKLKYKSKTINLRMEAVRFFCLYVLEKEWDRKFTPRIKEPKTTPNHLSPGEVAAILSSCSTLRERAIIMMFYSTGIRACELINIKIEELKKDISTIEVIGKGNKKRIIPLCESLREVLRKYWVMYRKPIKTGYLFVDKENQFEPLKYSEVYQIFKKVMIASGINKSCSPHTLRHSFATRMLELGVSLREIQLILGHSQIQSTEIYTHLRAAQLGSMKNPLESLVKSIKITA